MISITGVIAYLTSSFCPGSGKVSRTYFVVESMHRHVCRYVSAHISRSSTFGSLLPLSHRNRSRFLSSSLCFSSRSEAQVEGASVCNHLSPTDFDTNITVSYAICVGRLISCHKWLYVFYGS